MPIRILSAVLAVVLLGALAACGGGSQLERSLSAKGIVASKPGSSCPTAGKNSIIYFYDDGSSSSNGPIVKFEWNFGDGWEDATSTEGMAAHFYATPGTKVAHLRVTDSTGRKASEKIKVMIVDGFDADVVRMLWGVDESDESRQVADGGYLRYHHWRWRSLVYDPEDERYTENTVLAISPGDPDFDLLCVYSEGSAKDFVTPDLDGDGEDDDPSVRRTFVLPHILEVSGSCLGRSKSDVYVWKIKTKSTSGKTMHDYRGHVTVLK